MMLFFILRLLCQTTIASASATAPKPSVMIFLSADGGLYWTLYCIGHPLQPTTYEDYTNTNKLLCVGMLRLDAAVDLAGIWLAGAVATFSQDGKTTKSLYLKKNYHAC